MTTQHYFSRATNSLPIMKQNLLVFSISFLVVMLLNEIIINHKVNHRQVHGDEIYTFSVILFGDQNLNIDENHKVSNEKLYKSFFYLAPENRFAFKKLIESPTLAGDTHPYLHYILLHGLYSAYSYLNDGKFTPYELESISGVMNAIFQALSSLLMLLIFRKIYKQTDTENQDTKEKKEKKENFTLIAIIIGFYLVLPTSTYLTPFARMYCLYIFSCLLYAYFFISSVDKPSLTGYLGLTLASFLAFSSHYYSLIFIFAFLGIYFISRFFSTSTDKKWGTFLAISSFSILGLALELVVFPQSIWHMTKGHRAEQLLSLLVNYWYIFASFALLSLYAIYKLSRANFISLSAIFNTKETSVFTQNANLVFLGALGFFLAIMLVSPMKIMRYYSPVVPIFFIWGGIYLYHSKYMPFLQKNSKKIWGWIGAILLIYYTSSFILSQIYHKTFSFRDKLSDNVVILFPLKSADFSFSWNDVKEFYLYDIYDPQVLAQICDRQASLPDSFSLIDTYDLTNKVRIPKPIPELFDCLKNQGYSIGERIKFSRDSDLYEVSKL